MSPVDKSIQQHILNNLEPLETSWNTEIINTGDKLKRPLDDMLLSYLNIIMRDVLPNHKAINSKSSLTFVYTPLHGVGQNYIENAFGAVELKLIPVEEQQKPDPDFPTVKQVLNSKKIFFGDLIHLFEGFPIRKKGRVVWI